MGSSEARNSGLGTVGVREENPGEGCPLHISSSKLFTLKETRGEGSGGGGRRPGETSLRNVSLAGHLVLPWPLPHPAVTESGGPSSCDSAEQGEGAKSPPRALKGSRKQASNREVG